MSTPTPTPFVFDENKFKAHLDSIKEEQLKHAGKPNHNPFLWIATNVRPLEDAFAKGNKTEELYKKALALKADAPLINVKISAEEAAATPASVEPKAPAPQPIGLKLGSGPGPVSK